MKCVVGWVKYLLVRAYLLVLAWDAYWGDECAGEVRQLTIELMALLRPVTTRAVIGHAMFDELFGEES